MLGIGKQALWLALALFGAAGCADKERPSWPAAAALSVGEVDGQSVSVSWPTAQDNRAVVSYRVTLRDSQGNPPGKDAKLEQGPTSYTASGLSEATSYTLEVAALDEAGNVSSTLKRAVTTKDVTAPTWEKFGRLVVKREAVEDKTRLTFLWPAPSDNVGVTGLRFGRGAELAELQKDAQSHTLTVDNPDGIWQIEAGDAAGNWSKPLKNRVDLASAAARRARLTKAMARVGILKLLGSTGTHSAVAADIFGKGTSLADSAFSNVAGLKVGTMGGLSGIGRRRSGSGGGGRGVAVGIGSLGVRGVGGRGRYVDPTVKLASGGSSETRRYVRRKLSRIRHCYRLALKKTPALAGPLTVELKVDKAGKVSAGSLSGVTDPTMLACVKTALLGRGVEGQAGQVTVKLVPGSSPQ